MGLDLTNTEKWLDYIDLAEPASLKIEPTYNWSPLNSFFGDTLLHCENILEFDKSPPARDWCAHLVPWWGAGVGQASLLLILLILYRLFRNQFSYLFNPGISTIWPTFNDFQSSKEVLATNSDFLIPKSLGPNGFGLRYF